MVPQRDGEGQTGADGETVPEDPVVDVALDAEDSLRLGELLEHVLRAQYVFQEFTEAEGVLGIEGDIDDGIFGDSLSVSAGLTFSIPLRNQ